MLTPNSGNLPQQYEDPLRHIYDHNVSPNIDHFMLDSHSQENLLIQKMIMENIWASGTDNGAFDALGQSQKPSVLISQKGTGKIGKKDRHSKIFTKHGPRDRRMRLSLDIARKFFDLQDMLGFDKASKTVEWLLSKSKSAIKELSKGFTQNKRGISTSCKNLSAVFYSENMKKSEEIDSVKRIANVIQVNKEKSVRKSRLSTFDPQAKVSRLKARERAKERTRKKMLVKRLDASKQLMNIKKHEMNGWTPTSPLGMGDDPGSFSNEMKSSSDMVAEIETISQTPEQESVQALFSDYPHQITVSQDIETDNSAPTYRNQFVNSSELWNNDSAVSQWSYCTTLEVQINGVQRLLSSLHDQDLFFQPQFIDNQFFSNYGRSETMASRDNTNQSL